MDVTEQDLLEALQRALAENAPESAGFMTAVELEDALGWSQKRVSKALHLLAKQGKLQVQFVRRADITGRVQTPPGYRVKAL